MYPHNKTHGLSSSRFYTLWRSMLGRCYSEKCNGYERYGGEGITVCEEWHTFQNFMDDMYESFLEHERINQKDTSLDRIDNLAGYTKNNCRWLTRKAQSNNKKNNRLLEVDGVIKTVSQWSEECGIDKTTILHRMNKGYLSNKEIVTVKPRKKQKVLKGDELKEAALKMSKYLFEENKTIKETSMHFGCSYDYIDKLVNQVLPNVDINLYRKIKGREKIR